MAAKILLTIKAECINKQEGKNGGIIAFAVDIENGDKEITARKLLNYRTMDLKEIQKFSAGHTYTITITQ